MATRYHRRHPAAPRSTGHAARLGAGRGRRGVDGVRLAVSVVVVFATVTTINGTVHSAVHGFQLLLVALIWPVAAVACARRH
jgi:hypothetical protein